MENYAEMSYEEIEYIMRALVLDKWGDALKEQWGNKVNSNFKLVVEIAEVAMKEMFRDGACILISEEDVAFPTKSDYDRLKNYIPNDIVGWWW